MPDMISLLYQSRRDGQIGLTLIIRYNGITFM
jgi:hypothetical protein